MTEREPRYPDDEPVIGVNYPGYDTPDEDYVDGDYDGYDGYIGGPEPRIGADAWDDGLEDGFYQDPYDDYYYDEYYDATPARQPAFYIFLGVAVLLGGLLVFLLFQLLGGSGDGSPSPTPVPDFNISIDQPLGEERIEANTDIEAVARANATEPIVRMELLVNGQATDVEEFQGEPEDGVYTAEFTFSVQDSGTYELVARAISESGASQDSEPIEVIAVESIGDEAPSRITGEAVSNVNARSGPGGDFEALRTISAGETVIVVGRTEDGQWLLLEDDTWVRRAGIRLSESPELLEVVEHDPEEETPTPEPSPSPSPTAPTEVADLSPANAALDSGGSILVVNVSNLGSSAYEGPLVVRVEGLPGGPVEEVFSVQLGPNSTGSVDMALNPALTQGATIRVTVDPQNAIDETTEDNNSSAFTLAAPVQPPDMSIASVAVDGSSVTVTITNQGGDLPASSVSVVIAIGGAENRTTRELSLDSGDSTDFQVTAPANGDGTVSLLVAGDQLASASVTVGDDDDDGSEGDDN